MPVSQTYQGTVDQPDAPTAQTDESGGVSFQSATAVAAPALRIAGAGPVQPVGRFVIGWGFTFLALSLLTPVSPKGVATMAALVAAGALLGNGTAVAKDLSGQLASQGTPATGGVKGFRAFKKSGPVTMPPTVTAEYVGTPGA